MQTKAQQISAKSTEDTHKKLYAAAEKFGVTNIEKANLGSFTPAQVYTMARPVLEFAAHLFLMPKRWQLILTQLIATLDGLFHVSG